MSRLFNGGVSADSITFAVGNAPPDEGPITMAALVKPATATNWLGWVMAGIAGGANIWSMLVFNQKWFIERDFSAGSGPFTTDWYWAVVTKASGSTLPRWHFKNVTTGGAWSHTDAANTVTDGTGPITSLRVGNDSAGSTGDAWHGNIAACATWTSALADLAVEAACTLAASDLAAAAPGWMVRLNQANVATPVTDDTGGGGDQTAISGTSVDAAEPLGWSYALATSVSPTGFAVPVTFGSPTIVTPAAPVATVHLTGSWNGLADIARLNAQEAEQERRDGPRACPDCGEPLVRNQRTGVLGCTFDGWTFSGSTPLFDAFSL